MSFLDPDRPYTFSEIAKLKAPTDELVAEYGYALERKVLDLSKYHGELDRSQERRSQIEEILPYLDLTNEQSRREMLITPLMADLIHYRSVLPSNSGRYILETRYDHLGE